MKNFFNHNQWVLTVILMAASCVYAELDVATSDISNEFMLNAGIQEQPFFFQNSEPIYYSGRFQSYDSSAAKAIRVTITTDGQTKVLKEASPSESGSFELRPADYSVGYHLLKHDILNASGSVLASMEKGFTVLDPAKVELHTGELSQKETWSADKVHVIYGSFVIPSGRTLTITSGTILKFCTEASLDISSGAICFANGAIFTHINDDTIGGDTLNDGIQDTPTDAYAINGDLNYNDDTEFRFLTQLEELIGTISTDIKLHRAKTYTVSGTLTINGCTLTIPSGTVIKMESGASIEVGSDATLNALGTRAAPIIFTSIKDDTYKGDTNGDGDATVPQPGDWRQIYVNGGIFNASYVSLFYLSNDNNQGGIYVIGGNVNLDGCTIAHCNYDCMRSYGGTSIVRNSIFIDSSIGIAPSSGTIECINCVFSGLTTAVRWGAGTFKNCVFANIKTCFFDSTGSSPKNNCVFWNPEGYGPQKEDVVGTNGNIWGDPLFLDPENGDFRIPANSPCVDAADSDAAPEYDYYGQPRVTLTAGHEGDKPAADIGIYEVMPSDALGKVDFIPTLVVAETNAIPGETISVEWEIKNGGVDAINGSWRDTISLVTSYGKEITLGDCVIRGNIAKGETLSCSGVFIVPALNEGTYYPKVNLNSYHDFFEGMLSTNNVLIGKQPINIVLEGSNPNEPQEGTIKPGTPTVIKLHFDETDENRMIRFNLPAGVKVSWGFGFMPDGSSNSGFAISGDQDLVFLVPEGAIDVYIVLDSDNPAAYKYSSENSKMVITSVSPNTLPSSGTTTLTITGGGFGEKNAITLIHSSGNVGLGEYGADASGNIYATVDCSLLRAGTTYSLKVDTEEVSATLSNAVTVTGVAPFVDLVATLDAPANVRQGRTTVVYIDYVNKGNIDLPAPVFEIISNGQIFTVDGIKYTNSVKVVGLSKDAPVGMLHPNEPQRLGITVTIMSSNVKWALKSYHAGQESAKTTRFSLRELYNDDWVIYHESEDIELLSELRTAAGSKWSDFYTNFGSWLSSVEPSVSNFEKLKAAFGRYQYLIASGMLDAEEDDEEGFENNSRSNGINQENLEDNGNEETCHHELTCPPEPSKENEYNWKEYPRNGSIWRFCPKCNRWVSAVQGSNKSEKHIDSETYRNLDNYKINLQNHTFIICHGNANDVNGGFGKGEQWMYNMAKALSSKGNVLGINWAVGANQLGGNAGIYIPKTLNALIWGIGKLVSLGNWDLNLKGSAYYIPETVCEAIRELDVLGLDPSKTTIIGHSHGAHIAANIITHWKTFDKGNNQSNKGKNYMRFVGLDVSTTDNKVHSLNAMDPEEWIKKIKNCCDQVEFYKSSWDMSLEEDDQVFGHFNFALMRKKGDFWEFQAVGLDNNPREKDDKGFVSKMEVDRHGYSHKWFLKTIKNPAKYNNLGFAFNGWETLRKIAGGDIKFPGEDFTDKEKKKVDGKNGEDYEVSTIQRDIFAGVIRDDIVELLSYRNKNGKLLSPWRYEKVVLKRQEHEERSLWNPSEKSFRTLQHIWYYSRDFEIEATLPKPNRDNKIPIEGGMRIPYKITNNADNLSLPYKYLIRNEYKSNDSRIGYLFQLYAPEVTAILVDLEGIKKDLGYAATFEDIYDLVSFFSNDDEKCKKYCANIAHDSYGFKFAFPQGEPYKREIQLNIKNNIFGDDRPLTVYKVDSKEIDHYRDVMLVLCAEAFYDNPIQVFSSKELYSLDNYILKNVEAHPGDGFPVISETRNSGKTYRNVLRRNASVQTSVPKLSENALDPGEVVPVTADKNGRWSIGLNSAESYVLSGGKFTVNKFELTDAGDEEGEPRFENKSKTCEFIYVTISGQLPQDTDADDNLLCEGKKYNVQLTVVTDGEETNTNYCVLDVRYPLDDNEGKDEDKDSSFTPHSCDPNEMSGPLGIGDPEIERFVRPGELLTYTVYFENVTNATASAQEVRVSNPLSEYLDWSTFEMDEIVFNNQIDLGLAGMQSGTSEVAANGTNYNVRTQLKLDKEKGEVKWYMRIVDPSTETGWPDDILIGFLPPNDETYRGEGHLSYRIKVREDAPAGVTINNSATIVFDYNAPVETDPAWWNNVAKVNTIEIEGGTNVNLVVGLPFGELPVPEERKGWVFIGWFTGPNGMGRQITEDSIVEEGDDMLYQYWVRNKHDLVDDDIGMVVVSVYDGYVFDPNDRSTKGSMQAKVGKIKDGKAKISATIVMAGGEKAEIHGEMTAATGTMTTTTKNGRVVTLTFGENDLDGTYGDYEIDGARNLFNSKNGSDQAAANAALAAWGGVHTMVWDDGPGYAVASVSIGSKGKTKVIGWMGNGTKFSASGQLIIGKNESCVTVISKNKKTPLAFNLWFAIGEETATEGVSDDAVVSPIGPLVSDAFFMCDYLTENIPIFLQKGKWSNNTGKDISLKLSYKDKDGTFKGSFKVNKQKAIVNGVVVDGVGYGSAVMKNTGFKPVIINSTTE